MNILSDSTIEFAETFRISVAWEENNGAFNAPARTFTIADAGTLFSATGPTAIDESVGAQQFSVARIGQATTGTVTWTINHGTAADATDSPTTAADFSDLTGTVAFTDSDEAGDITKTFTVNIVDDSIEEDTENFNISLSFAKSNAGNQTTVSFASAYDSSITDDDAEPRALTLTLLDGPGGSAATTSVIAESDSDAAVWYRAGISTGTAFANPTELMWSVASGDPSVSGESGTADDDFSAVTGTVTMPASPTTQVEFSIMVAGDNRNEDTEYFTVSIAAVDATANGGTQASGGVVAGISDDDQVEITLSGGGRHPESDPADEQAMLHVDFGAELTRDFQVRLDISRGSGLPDTSNNIIDGLGDDVATGTDWLPASPPPLSRSQVAVDKFIAPAGSTTISIQLNTFADDNLNEADELYWAVLTNLQDNGHIDEFIMGALVSRDGAWGDVVALVSSQVYTIVDNDPITVVVTAAANTVAEGQPVRFDITLEGASEGAEGNFELLYTLTGLEGVGVTPSDPGNGRLRFIRNPSLMGPDFLPDPMPTTGAITVTIPPTSALGAMDMDETLTLEITGVRRLATSSTFLNSFEYSDLVAGEITSTAPRNQASVAVQWTGFAHEFTLTSSPTTVAEGSDGNPATATYTLTRAGSTLTNPLEITWSVEPGTAQAADFMATSGAVEFSGTETSKDIEVVVVGDDLNEASETFTIRFAVNRAAAAAEGSVSLPGPHQTTITDDDAISATLEILTPDADGATNGYQLRETTFARFRITMDHASAADATIQYDISGDVETADYAGATTRTVVILAGRTTADVTIQILADADTDASESMTVALTAGGHSAAGTIARSGTESERSVTVLITPLTASRMLQLTRIDAAGETTSGAIVETDDTVTARYRVSLAAGGTGFPSAASLRWFVTGGDPSVTNESATNSDDFDAVSGAFQIGTGAGATADFQVSVAGDNRNEDTEYFSVTVAADNPAADGGTSASNSVTTAIADDDRVEITLSGGRSFPEDTAEVDVVVDFGAELTRPFHVGVLILRNDVNSSASNTAHNTIDIGTDYGTGTGYLPASSPIGARSQIGFDAFVALAGAITASFPLAVVGCCSFEDDNLNEADERFWVTLDDQRSPEADADFPGIGVWGEVVFPTPDVVSGVWDSSAFAAYTIVDNDPITVTVVAAANTVAEGRSVRFDITLTGASEGADGHFDLLYTLDGLAGVTPTDSGGGRLQFRRRSDSLGTETAGTVTVFIPFTDSLGAGNEDQTLTFRITGVEEQPTPPIFSGGAESFDFAIGEINIPDAPDDRASVTVTWTDDTPDHTFTLSTPTATVAEPAMAMGAPATFEVERTGPNLATTIGITWSIQPGDAAAEDFDGTEGSVSFFGDQTTRTFVVHAAVDSLNEGDESFTIQFGLADANAAATAGGAAPPAAHSAVITDNADDAIEVRIVRDAGTPAMITESSTATATFNIGLHGGQRTGDVTVPYTFGGAGITADDFNITTPSGVAASAVGGEIVFSGPVQPNPMRSVTVTLQDDTQMESNEPLTLTGADAGPAGLRTASGGVIGYAANASTATVVIIDDGDTGPSFDMQAPQFRDDHLGWSAGQRTLWLTTDEDYKVLAYPSGARAASGTPSLTTLDAGGFMVIENNGLASAATLSVTSVRLIPQSRALALTPERAIAADAANVWVSYRRVAGNAIYDTAVENGDADPSVGRNALLSQGPFRLPQSGNTDTDGDGMPDTVEIAIGENPLETVAAERMPVFSLSRTAAQNPVAYSGIREHGVQAHLGYAATGAATVTAYYRSDTFGYLDGSSYECDSGPFPANYAAPLSEGGCAAVDWGDILPGVDHTIAWLARSADGVWSVRSGGSRLPQQVIRRIPELNMDAQSLFTTGAVTIGASLDAAPGETLTLNLLRTPVGGGAATMETASGEQTFEVTRTSAASAEWEIAGLEDSGGTPSLYRPNTPTDGFTANHPVSGEYSLGLVRQTRVTRVNVPVPPVLGRAWLAFSTVPNDATHVLRDNNGQNLYVVVENNDDIGAGTSVMLSDNGVLRSALPQNFVSSISAYPITLNVNAAASSVTDTAVFQVTVTGGFGGVTTATYRYPVRPATHPLAQTAVSGRDSDEDGIIDDIDDFDNSDHLPVVVDEEAGASAWHHIRPALPLHDLRLGEMTVARLSSATMNDQVDEYAEYSASSVPDDAGLAVVYDFEIAGVDYAEVTEEGRTGGAAGVIIPLPRSLYDGGASLVKYPSNEAFSVEGDNDYGFAPLQDDGACPDDTMAAGSPYRDGETLRRAKRGGDACLAVYIVDGGANDEDGLANGVIKDPLGIRAGGVGGGAAGSSGGALGPLTLAGLLLMLALSLAQIRRRRARLD